MKTAVCPGSFDPVTNGHLDIIFRASKLCEKLIVLVSKNGSKNESFSPEERAEMIKTVLSENPGCKNIEVECFSGLLADYVNASGADAIIKGLRAVSDFEYEFQMALVNKKLCPNAETVFLTAASEYMYLSSSVIKQILPLGGNINDFVPTSLIPKLNERLK